MEAGRVAGIGPGELLLMQLVQPRPRALLARRPRLTWLGLTVRVSVWQSRAARAPRWILYGSREKDTRHTSLSAFTLIVIPQYTP